MKVLEGVLEPGTIVHNSTKNVSEKLNQVYLVRGKFREEVHKLTPGRIGTLVKLKSTKTGDTLTSLDNPISLDRIEFTPPQEKIAIVPKTKKDEEKVSEGLSRLNEEDPSFTYTYDTETQQSILITQGELHLDVIFKQITNKV